ncbi:MAG: hypothetical protein M1823_006319 [Watsoniomyces obsoletus]|nr:MAG: hypothetical protein M1823_006319 [Watsoniomyces obsoletus]
MAILGGPPDRQPSAVAPFEKFHTVVHILRAHYKERFVGPDQLMEKTCIKWIKLARTFINMVNRRINSLQDFLEKDILAEIERLDPAVRSNVGALYLAVEWSEKDGPTQLSRTATHARDIKELLQHFKPVSSNASTNVFVTFEVLDKNPETSYEGVSASEANASASDSEDVPIKQEGVPHAQSNIKLL